MASVVANAGQEIPQADFLETRFGLSPAEARLVALLFAGASLRSSATALGIKYETVRSYLKSAFQKTGTHRQAELVLRVFQAMSDSNPPVPAAIAAQGLRTTVENGRGTPIYPHLGAMSNKGGTHNYADRAHGYRVREELAEKVAS
jgi:DNA-binding CsgD family transcriptional regulator